MEKDNMKYVLTAKYALTADCPAEGLVLNIESLLKHENVEVQKQAVSDHAVVLQVREKDGKWSSNGPVASIETELMIQFAWDESTVTIVCGERAFVKSFLCWGHFCEPPKAVQAVRIFQDFTSNQQINKIFKKIHKEADAYMGRKTSKMGVPCAGTARKV